MRCLTLFRQIVAVADVGERIQDAISLGEKLVKKDLKADKKELDKEIREILARRQCG